MAELRSPIVPADLAALAVLSGARITATHALTRSGTPTNRVDHCRRIVDWFDAHT